MQVDGALRGGSTIPRRRSLKVLLAILVIAAMAVLLVWVVPLATSGVGAEDAIPKAGAGSAIVHDDAGKVSRYSYPLPHGKVANPNAAGVGSAVIHDDAGNVHRNAGSAVIHDDPGNVHPD